MGVFLTCQPCSAPGRRPAFCFHFPPSLPLPHDYAKYSRGYRSPLRARANCADLPENQRSRGGLLMRARLFTWLNAARDEAVRRAAALHRGRVLAHGGRTRPAPAARAMVEAGITVVLPVVRERNARWPSCPGRRTPHAQRRLRHPGTRRGRRTAARRGAGAHARLYPFGDRVGYGGGYYDRMAALRDGPALHRHRHRLELRRAGAGRRLRAGRTTTRWTPS